MSSNATAPLTRRRFIRICAAATAGLALPSTASAAGAKLHRWTGVALGARAEINLVLKSAEEAEYLFKRIEAEIRRLEAIFSLYRTDSELSRLNRDGHLAAPSQELVELLGLSRRLFELTEGAFDPTVQRLWELHARQTAQASSDAEQPAAFDDALSRTGFDRIVVEAAGIRFRDPGMAITLNGIAQGYITDRVATLLTAAGCLNTLVDLGEISATGTAPPESGPVTAGWPVTLRPDPGQPDQQADVHLNNMAVASSARLGTTFDQAGARSHILDPRSGLPVANDLLGASVLAPTAALADGLSTAALVTGERGLAAMLSEIPGACAFIVRESGSSAWL
ncbi:FAD:protein FMN transferase [Roseibium sp.]|uniref:FAD:protein FMN transferase n=1 Tax=Roseibium sp. TaxID=1936156 RepID=UPI003BB011B0